jgi:glycosyltransferase involved in cell wall biosynthesis
VPLSLLTFTTLYPNASQPNHGVFVENRLRHLVATGKVHATVLAPVAWFPGRIGQPNPPRLEQRADLTIHHPRWLSIPAIGMAAAPTLLFRSAATALERLLDQGAHFDAIDAHYFYPDGVAAIRLGARFNLPVVITARGSDITQFPSYAVPRRLILDAAQRAAAIITVSASLRDSLIGLGAPPEKITVLRNGVDLSLFHPTDRTQARAALGLTGPTLLSVGALIPRKGHDRTIATLPLLPDWTFLIAGEGPERDRLERLAQTLNVSARVKFLGGWPHHRLASLYSAADLSILASSREGWANVLLESMACGTPVIASPIPGNTEVIQSPQAGAIADANTPEAFARAIKSWQAAPPPRTATRTYAEGFSWAQTTAGQLKLFSNIIATSPPPPVPLPAKKNPLPLTGEGGVRPEGPGG